MRQVKKRVKKEEKTGVFKRDACLFILLSKLFTSAFRCDIIISRQRFAAVAQRVEQRTCNQLVVSLKLITSAIVDGFPSG
jgi:hypothetical protein